MEGMAKVDMLGCGRDANVFYCSAQTQVIDAGVRPQGTKHIPLIRARNDAEQIKPTHAVILIAEYLRYFILFSESHLRLRERV